MKEVNLKDKSLFDISRNITSILGVGKSKTTDDKNGFIIQRENLKSNLYHILIVKKFIDAETKKVSFSLEVEEGTLNPMKMNKSMKLKDLISVEVCFPSVMAGEEKKIKFKTVNLNGNTREIEVGKDILSTHNPKNPPVPEKPKKRLRRYKKDDVIFKEGDLGNEMYIIQNGKVGLFKDAKDETVKLSVLGKNSFFGEMALFGIPHRSATARAIENSDLLVISKELFEYQIDKIPSWFVTMFKALIERLRKANEIIGSLKNQISESEEKIPDKNKS